MICSSGGSKSRLATAAGAKPSRQMRNQKHFWKLRYWKTAHGCGTKHMWKSKCTKRLRFGALLEVEMFKKCTALRREAYLEVKMLKTPQSNFGSWDVQKVHAVVARSTCSSQNGNSTAHSNNFWNLRCWKSALCCGAKHIWKSKSVKVTVSDHFLVRMWLHGRRNGFCTLSKVSKAFSRLSSDFR